MARYFLKLSYNGTTFNGWQVQDNTPNTIQQIIQEKLGLLLKENIELVGCGRTDAGVHAKNYIAHFDSNCTDLISNKAHWVYKFSTILPPQIAIQDIMEVDEKSHARFDALSRTYYYFLHQQKDPFIDQFSYYVYGDLDFELMNKAAQILLQYKDFTSFSKLNTQTHTNNCIITKAIWQQIGNGQWRFTIRADRFLRGMVRAIVGTLLQVGKNKITIEEFKKIIEAKDRSKAGNNVPAHALFLVAIEYPKDQYSE